VGVEEEEEEEEVLPEEPEVMEEGRLPHTIALPNTGSLRAIADSRVDAVSDVRMPIPPAIPALPDITSSTQDMTQETSLVAFSQELPMAVNSRPQPSLNAPGSSMRLPARTHPGRPQPLRNTAAQNSRQPDVDDFPRPPALSSYRLSHQRTLN
jgi:hypothetical protein